MKKTYALLLLLTLCVPGESGETALGQRVAEDTRKAGIPQKEFVYYTVEPMSNIKRTASTYPEDGKLHAPLRFIAAQDEYEPASFVLFPFQSAAKVELIPGELKGKNGTIPASALDLKVVKLWFQTGTGWYSYFADTTGKTILPELLLNDESLVDVDLEHKENYLRVKEESGKEHRRWISAPAGTYEPLNPHRVTVADAETLQPFTLRENEFKQIWATFHAPSEAEGVYKGSIQVRIDGKDSASIPVEVRVLPFRLPTPKTNYNPAATFFAGNYNATNLSRYVNANGGNVAKAEQRVRAEYASYRKHNLLYPLIPARNIYTKPQDAPLIRRQLEIYKESGLGSEVLFDAVTGFPAYSDLDKIRKMGPDTRMADAPLPEKWAKIVTEEAAFVRSLFGKDIVIYCFGWDEPGMWLLRAERRMFKFLHDNKLKVFTTGGSKHLLNGAFNEDFSNYGGRITKKDTEIWHAAGSKISSYADPHTGIENPDFVRRTHGMYAYLNNSDGSMNYIVNGSDWNDFVGTEYNFRSFNWIYPGTFKPVETIQYEAFREAIDDVKYATLLKQYAAKALASEKPEQVYAARAALLYLAQIDPEQCDLNALRSEMIRHILKLKDLK